MFVSADNLVNLLFDCSTVGVISLGNRLRADGRPDRPVGRLDQRAFASALVGTLWVNAGWPVPLAILAALAAGALIGALYALLFKPARPCPAS